MVRIIVKRLLLFPLLLLVFSVISFALIQAPPGDYLTAYIAALSESGSSIDMSRVQALEQQYGLDQPIYVQYGRWVAQLVQGDLGMSLEYQRPNAQLIGGRLVLTILLALASLIVTWVLAVPIGILSATRQYSVLDYLFTVINYIGLATPNFMLALILLWFAFSQFGVNLSGLYSPAYENAPWSWGKFVDLLSHLWIPAVIVGTAGTASIARVIRANLLDELGKPYTEMARARGMAEWRLVLKYPVRIAINPVISTIGWYLPNLFSGGLIVAVVMNLPTIGPLLLQALLTQDMYLAGTIVLIYCFLTIIGTLISDLLLAWLDPRIRLEGA